MDNNSNSLIESFHKIAKKGYIKGIGKSWGNIGLTFENEIGKLPDSKYDPDYKDIEIKCTSRYSRYPLYLFTLSFDSNVNEILDIAKKYGMPDKDYPEKYIIFEKITQDIDIDKKYSFSFKIDCKERKIYLCVHDSNGKLIEQQAYITFDSLKKHLDVKLKKIAYIKASTKKIYSDYYYRYYSMYLYNFRGFTTFLELLKNGIIKADLVARISKSGPDKGRYRNKKIVFSIKKENISKLFECYYQFNYDNIY